MARLQIHGASKSAKESVRPPEQTGTGMGMGGGAGRHLASRLWYNRPESQGSNPDRVRHFSASRRELMTQVLHLLAPDQEIHAWSDAPDLYDNGRPTRVARLCYICRSIECFTEFVKIDYRLMLRTFDIFQKGTHAVETHFTPEQLSAASTRADQQLLFLLRLHAASEKGISAGKDDGSAGKADDQ